MILNIKIYLLFISFLILQLSLTSNSYSNIYVVITEKQEKKKSTRWSLAEWMETKNKIALMDRWLALHTSPVIFEGSLGGDYGKYKNDNLDYKFEKKGIDLSLYFLILGFNASYTQTPAYENTTAGINLRILGLSYQGTNIIVGFGQNNRKTSSLEIKNHYYSLEFSLYILKSFGVKANYKNYIKNNDQDTVFRQDGEKLSAEVFKEFNSIRIYLKYSKENLYREYLTQEISQLNKESGHSVGLRLYF